MEGEGHDAEGGEEEERGAGQQGVEPVLVAGVGEPKGEKVSLHLKAGSRLPELLDAARSRLAVRSRNLGLNFYIH